MKKNKTGGDVVDAGGFGCVFEPDLKCVGQTTTTPNTISKLMSEKHANEELREITIIKERVQHIPNYQEFFLLDNINICKPSPLSSSDLVNFDKRCKPLVKRDITARNINESLDDLRVLNMPHGGIPVDDFIQKASSQDKLFVLGQSLKDLLIRGIVPMNKSHVFHSDIKDSNVLVGLDLKTRLIDWGLSVDYIPHQNNTFPRTWRNRPLQYNSPFSIILFSDMFVEQYSSYLKSGGTKKGLRKFVSNYIYSWLQKRGLGHYNFINDIMYILFSRDITKSGNKREIVEIEYTLIYITDYLVYILENFTTFKPDGSFKMRKYLDNVFIHIVDMWGFIAVYCPLLEFLNTNYDVLSDTQHQLFELLKTIFLKHLYSPRIIPNNLGELVSDIDVLNNLLEDEISTAKSIARGVKLKFKRSKLRRNSSLVIFKRTRKNRNIKHGLVHKNTKTNRKPKTKTTPKYKK